MSKQLYEKSRRVLMPVFDNVDTDVNVCACYTQLAMYLASADEVSKANFFLENAEISVDTLKMANDDPDIQTHIMFLEFVLRTIHAIVEEHDLLTTLRNVSYFRSLMHRITIEDEIQTSSAIATPLNDVVQIVDEQLLQFLPILVKLGEVLPSRSLHSQKLTFELLSLGVKLWYYKSSNLMDENTLQFANSVTEITMSDYFAICPPFVCSVVIEAAIVHAHFVETKIELIDYLIKDFRALKVMGERHEIASRRNESFMEGLEQLIDRLQADKT
jgi:hypothetical protein